MRGRLLGRAGRAGAARAGAVAGAGRRSFAAASAPATARPSEGRSPRERPVEPPDPRRGPLSAVRPASERERPAEAVAGFLAALAIFGGLIAVVERPVTIGLFSLFLALVAAGMASGRHRGLAAFAVGIVAASWFAGMVICALTGRPLW